MRNYWTKFKIWGILIGVLTGAVAAWLVYRSSPAQGQKLAEFAKCLAEKQLTMYGAYWCPHCQEEKKAFGPAFSYVPYVECTQQPQTCLDQGIARYPTWIAADGQRYEGEQGLARLAEISGCPLP